MKKEKIKYILVCFKLKRKYGGHNRSEACDTI